MKYGPLYEINSKTDCWEWTRPDSNGEPKKLWLPDIKQSVRPERITWNEQFPHDPVTSRQVLVRVCETKACVNPRHFVRMKKADYTVRRHYPDFEVPKQELPTESAKEKELIVIAASSQWRTDI